VRRIFLFFIILLNILILPTAKSEDKVIIDKITQQQAEELNIVVPDDVPAGFHTVTIQVSDDNGVVSSKKIAFCKDLRGDVHWDDICPDLEDSLAQNKDASAKVPFDPLQDKEGTKGIQMAAFAILSLLTTTRRNDDREKREEDQDQESLQSVSAGTLLLLNDEPGWGDNSKTWRNPLTTKSDSFFLRLANFFNGRSPLLTRTTLDGNSIRAIIGGWAGLTLPIGVILGILAITSVHFESLPPSWTLVAAIMAISIFDAFSGFLAGTIFLLGALVTGHITNRPEFLTAIGLLVLFFSPALLASTFRPFRRLVRNGDDSWERITDYVLGALLSYWAITKMVGAMNGLARLDLPISKNGQTLALIAAVLLPIRRLIEDIAVAHYPMRLRTLHIEIAEITSRQKIQSLVFKILVFFLMAAPFAGSLLNLLLGTLIFAFPLFTSLTLEDRFPKTKLYLPTGVLKTVAMVFVMALISKWIEGLFQSTASFLRWSFVVMALPGFFLHYLDAMSDPRNPGWRMTKNGRLIYRLGGVIIFILMVLIVRGVDIAGWLVD
jgi:hypothetical protein